MKWAALNKIANPDETTCIGLNTAKTMLALITKYQTDQAPVWLLDAAEALGAVRPDGIPLNLNWNQVLESIRDLRREPNLKNSQKAEVMQPRLPKLVWDMTRWQMILATLDMTKGSVLGYNADHSF